MPKVPHIARTRRPQAQLRTLIFKSASDLFAKQGFSETSIREIAEGANVTLATLYRFFSDKRDIYTQCCKAAARRYFQAQLLAQGNEESGEVILYRLIRFAVTMDKEVRSDYTLLNRASVDGDSKFVKNETERFQRSPAFKMVLDAVERGCGGRLALLRLAMIDRLANQLPATFKLFPGVYDGEHPDAFVTDFLEALLPSTDWRRIAESA